MSDRPAPEDRSDRWEARSPPPLAPAEFADGPPGPADLEGAPVLPVLCSLESGGDLWCATARGVLRRLSAARREAGEPRWRYYAGKRWLPDDRVTGLAADGAGGLWVRTETGFAHLRFPSMTLEEKARRFEERIRDRHLRHGLVAPCRLVRPGDLSSAVVRPDDNDGLWTAIYIAAESFRFAATGSEEARRHAGEAYRALARLEEVSGIPGLPARSVAEPLEPTGDDGEWHSSPDGKWLWKGDTSSDEIDGHFFAAAVFHHLAATEEERESIRRNIRAIMDHIIGHGLHLVDADGKPTRWGVWAPEELNGDPRWSEERGLNSLEVLSHLAVAGELTGDPRYLARARELVEKHGYAENAVRQIELGKEDNHSDDQLAFLSYYPLLAGGRGGELRAAGLASLERTYRAVAPETNPLYTFIAAAAGLREAGAGPGGAAALERAVRALRDTPLDMVGWRMENSHRRDIERAGKPNRFGEAIAAKPLHPAERGGLKYNSDPYVLDGGGGGGEEDDGAFFLLSYWMGRYHGLIAAPGGN